MKKRIYFSISSIIQMLVSIYVIVFAQKIVESQLSSVAEMYAMFPVEFQERMVNMLQHGMPIMMRILSIIILVLNAIVLKEAIQNKILKKKEMLLIFSCICLFIENSIIVVIFSIINFIVLLCSKRKNPEDFPDKEKKEIPKIEYQKSSLKEIILGIVLLLIYLSQFGFDFILQRDINIHTALGLVIGYYVIVFVAAILIYRKRLINDIKLFISNKDAYFSYLLPRVGIMYLVFIAVSLASIIISRSGVSVNQSQIEALPKWFIIPTAVIWAPIVEEAVYRITFRRFLKNNIAFIIISAVIFGLAHTLSEASIFNAIVMALPYSVLGGFLAYIYSKTENASCNILVHFFQNALAMTLSSILMFTLL